MRLPAASNSESRSCKDFFSGADATAFPQVAQCWKLYDVDRFKAKRRFALQSLLEMLEEVL
jgi:hypothetical protein